MAAVCVFCASSTRIDPSYVQLATQVGTGLARRGHSLVTGGGTLSMMGAVARGVRAVGGHTTGVIPRTLLDLEVGDISSDELLVVGDMRERKGLMDARSDAFLALPGGLGTLEELLEVWVARSLGLHAKPVVVLDVDGLYDPLRSQLDLLLERGFARPQGVAAMTWTYSVKQALEAIDDGLANPVRLRPDLQEDLEAEP